jgi:hypothetical protein
MEPGSTNANITVILTVSDTVNQSSVKLFYKIAGNSTWNNKTMVPTGAVYYATIGPFAFGTTVNYYVNATDTLRSSTCTPNKAPTSYYNATLARMPSGPPAPYLTPTTESILISCFTALAIITIAGLLLSTRSKKSTGPSKTHRK